MAKSKSKNIVKYILVFVTFSFLGWVLEQISNLIFSHPISFEKLSLHYFGIPIPFLPIYGLGGLILMSVSNLMDKSSFLKKEQFPFFRALIQAKVLTLFELFSGILCELVFGFRLWDYSSQPLNFLGYISILSFAVWLFFSFIFEYARKMSGIKY